MQTAFPWKGNIPQLVLFVSFFLLNMMPGDTDVLYVPDEALIPNAQVVYTHYTDKLPWNKAQEACRQVHGGTLVTIDSYDVWVRIHDLANDDWNNWDHCWTGLHWSSSSERKWIDSTCQPYEDHGAPFKDASQADHESGKACYILDSGTVAFEKKSCSDEFGFICQHYESDPNPVYEQISMDLQAVDASSTDCQTTCNQILGCFLNSQLTDNTCILGILDDSADTFGKRYSYKGDTGSLSGSVKSLINSLVSNVNNPEVCDETNFNDPPFAGGLVPVDNVDSGLELECPSEAAQTVVTTSVSIVTQNVSLQCAEVTTTMTTTDYAVSTVHFTTTETETASDIINCTIEQNVIVSTTNVITTTPLYVTSTIVTSLPCQTTSSTLCPSCSCNSPQEISTSALDTSTTSMSTTSVTSTPSIPSIPTSVILLDTSPTILTPFVSSVNVQELYREIREQIVQDLKIDSKSTAKAQARLKSASDSRPSAQAMGLVAGTILSLTVGIIVVADIPTFYIVCQSHMKSLRKMARKGHC